MKGGNMIHALSIDLEEWYHSELVQIEPSGPSQIVPATQPILELLDRYQTKATFFVVGDVAERHPDFIEAIFKRGHEIACHTYTHTLVWKMAPEQFREELGRFQEVIGRILGTVRIKGFRAPCFSIDNRNRWALRVLIEMGYLYDSSIFPLKINPLYGVREAPIHPYRISLEDVREEDPKSPLFEFPFCPVLVGRVKLPLSGGFYLRLCPFPLLRWGLRRMSRSHPFLVYLHPWEGFPQTPRVKTSLYNRIILYYGSSSVLKKLEYLLKNFQFNRLDYLLGLT